MSEGEEDEDEDEDEGHQVGQASRHGGGQLGQSSVEADELEQLQGGKGWWMAKVVERVDGGVVVDGRS